MNGVVITTALREKECTEALQLVLDYTPKPRKIVLCHSPGRPELDAEWPKYLAAANPEVIYRKLTPGQSGGMTAAWNLGFRILRDEGCDAIVCMNDDVYVNSSWPNIFATAREYTKSMVGPVSNKPGVDYTRHQKQAGTIDKVWVFEKEQYALKGDGSSSKEPLFCVNGFCFALHGSLCDDLILEYGEVLDQAGYPWGGQEEDLGRRIEKMGGTVAVDGRTYVIHLKFSDWRTHGLKNQDFRPRKDSPNP